MPARKRSRSSGAMAPAKRVKSSKVDMDNGETNDKHLVSDKENADKKMRVAKRAKTKRASANPERWTPYFGSKRLHTIDHGDAVQSAAADDERAADSTSLESAAMQECQSIRRALIEIIGPDNHSLNLPKLRAEFDTGADDCLMTQSCYQQLKPLLDFQTGKADIEGATAGKTTMTQYAELDLNIGAINFPPGIKFWVDATLPEDAGFDVLLSGPFLAHHNVICIDPKLQREIQKEGTGVLETQKHFDFLSFGVNRKLTVKETKGMSHWH